MTVIRGTPKINGISFRRFEDKSDYALMSEISRESWLADGFEWIQTAEDMADHYRENERRDPKKDILMIMAEGKVVGYGEVVIENMDEDTCELWNSVHLLPNWRGKGIREAVFDFNEEELIDRARKTRAKGYFQTYANEAPNDWKSLVLSRGFVPSWYVLEMVRPNLDDVPSFELPRGLEIRKMTPDKYRQVWEGMKEAYVLEPWYSKNKFSEARYRQWVESPDFSSELWQVAWEGDKVVGIVQNYIKREENAAFGRSRGHTERIYVVPRWQRKGVAKALISKSLKMLREMGLKDATLDVNAQNVSGALRLYQSLGYQSVHNFTFYRKPLP